MKAMILAAGRGERMRPLTDNCPKPLLKVAGKPLIDHILENLAEAGYTEIVINLCHLGEQIVAHCGDGQQWGVSIAYSDEGETALETAGGIAKALPLLGSQPFLVVNGDVACDFPLQTLHQRAVDWAHLVMIDNPPHHPDGDFFIDDNGLLSHQGKQSLTFSGIGIYHPRLFDGIPPEPMKMRPLLNQAIDQGRISGEKHSGFWLDIGTPQRLKDFADWLTDSSR